MTIPTGHQTFTSKENRSSKGALWKDAREGDTYIDMRGRHWECRGTFVKPAPNEVQQTIEAMKNKRANDVVDAMAYGMRNWRQERGIPAAVEIKYETSYTRQVVEQLSALTISTPRAKTAITSAINLLKDYHKSLHAPYEQRDKARQDLTVAEAQLAAVQNKLRWLRVRFSHRMQLLTRMATRWKKDLET